MVSAESQGHIFKLHTDSPRCGGGRRGSVVGFSRASRKRLLDRLARLRDEVDPLFLTLTFPDPVDCRQARRCLDSWAKRMRRRFPMFAAVWRIELQKRGVPHFHLLIWGCPFLPVSDVRELWRDVIGYEGPHTVQIGITQPRGWRAVAAYVSKYMAKPQDGAEMAESVLSAGFLDPVTYLTAIEGRSWGVIGRDCLPWAELRSMSIPFGRWFFRFRRIARRAWRRIGNQGGFTLRRDDSLQWWDALAWCLADGG